MSKHLPTLTLGQFLDVHELVLEVRRRTCFESDRRYFAYIPSSWTLESDEVRSRAGDGSTPEEAILDYIENISGKTLVFNISGPPSRSILVPNLSGIE